MTPYQGRIGCGSSGVAGRGGQGGTYPGYLFCLGGGHTIGLNNRHLDNSKHKFVNIAICLAFSIGGQER